MLTGRWFRTVVFFLSILIVGFPPSLAHALYQARPSQVLGQLTVQEEKQIPSVAPQVPVQQPVVAPQPTVQQAAPLSSGGSQEYILGVGDKVQLTVYGEKDLSGEYEVSSTGVVALPLIGDVPAAGWPIRAFEQAVRTKLADGYLHDPRVSVQVANYRPFFILGEVAKPGSYPYVNGMTVLNAVALAGGYTYRADKDGIKMTRGSDASHRDVEVEEGEVVLPGDIIRVPERFF